MRRLLLFALPVSAGLGLLVGAWASCADDYRDVLPFRGYDAAPREAGQDLGGTPADLAQPATDLSGSDGGAADGGTVDGGAADGGTTDAGMTDGGTADAGMTG